MKDTHARIRGISSELISPSNTSEENAKKSFRALFDSRLIGLHISGHRGRRPNKPPVRAQEKGVYEMIKIVSRDGDIFEGETWEAIVDLMRDSTPLVPDPNNAEYMRNVAHRCKVVNGCD